MSRQPVRQRPPADDDLTGKAAEEKRKLAESAPASTMQTPGTTQMHTIARSPAASHGGETHGAPRENYFGGRYSALHSDLGSASAEAIANLQLAKFGLPASLSHCVVTLIHILRQNGLGAALAAMHKDPAIDKKYVDAVGRLLAAVHHDERKPHA